MDMLQLLCPDIFDSVFGLLQLAVAAAAAAAAAVSLDELSKEVQALLDLLLGGKDIDEDNAAFVAESRLAQSWTPFKGTDERHMSNQILLIPHLMAHMALLLDPCGLQQSTREFESET
eukprot:CAMPEP_0206425340 /NCGR_PEP_ID=MMETSP0324_2-20121206/3735_1 /ASSEMBLY_ACC=CAM_ASM_000836 /TAXON_ID=2866 /ORGANISM="Crypthecodinium cohnii, Strain Seligo" /LENGTH=117 /DNA_ID=CAMNT_0053890107 /DNA_START=383 /DNA_END=740 /DNA_ORIENTATION=-